MGFVGPLKEDNCLVVIDAHLRCPEDFCTKSKTSAQTTGDLTIIFSRFGLPLQLVSENAQKFANDKFTQFIAVKGI